MSNTNASMEMCFPSILCYLLYDFIYPFCTGMNIFEEFLLLIASRHSLFFPGRTNFKVKAEIRKNTAKGPLVS